MIVVVVLGILAALVVPSLTNATTMARENTLKEDVRFMRSQIVAYQVDHIGTAPGYPGGNRSAVPTEAVFLSQMLTFSNPYGATNATASSSYPLGPYLRRMPDNPISGLDTITTLANGAAFPNMGDDSTGWVYQAATGKFAPNNDGNDSAGTAFIDY